MPKLHDRLFGLIGFLFQIIIACMIFQATMFPGAALASLGRSGWLGSPSTAMAVGAGCMVGGTQISLISF